MTLELGWESEQASSSTPPLIVSAFALCQTQEVPDCKFSEITSKIIWVCSCKKKKKETLQQVLVEKSWMYNSMNFHKLITPVPAKGPSILASDSMLIVPGFVFHMNVIRQHTLQHGFVFFFLLIFMFVGFIGIVACSFKSFIFIVL